MLWLPLGLSTFPPAVRFDRPCADGPGTPAGMEGSSWAGKRPAPSPISVYPVFSYCGYLPCLLPEADCGLFQRQSVLLFLPS